MNDAGRGKFVVNLDAPQNYVQQTPLYHPSACSGNDSEIHSLPRTLDMKPELFDATNGRPSFGELQPKIHTTIQT
jgi:hypothetical protein